MTCLEVTKPSGQYSHARVPRYVRSEPGGALRQMMLLLTRCEDVFGLYRVLDVAVSCRSYAHPDAREPCDSALT